MHLVCKYNIKYDSEKLTRGLFTFSKLVATIIDSISNNARYWNTYIRSNTELKFVVKGFSLAV